MLLWMFPTDFSLPCCLRSSQVFPAWTMRIEYLLIHESTDGEPTESTPLSKKLEMRVVFHKLWTSLARQLCR